MKPKFEFDPARNNSFLDAWSITHIIYSMLLAWVMSPWVVLAIMTLWEPIEIFVISPILAKYGIGFGYEGPLNSFSDILFNIVGILIGYYLLREIATPPFYLFN